MTPEQDKELLELLKKQLRVQKRNFILHVIGTGGLLFIVGMWLVLWAYSG